MISKTKFDQMNVYQKRVAIAKDVLKRIKSEKIHASRGIFLNYGFLNERKVSKKEINQNKCYVCAKGAVFCAWVGNFNKFSEDVTSVLYFHELNEDYPKDILKVFSRKLMDRMEAAFERRVFDYHRDKPDCRKFVNMVPESMNQEDALKLVMNYLIKNNGKFPAPKFQY